MCFGNDKLSLEDDKMAQYLQTEREAKHYRRRSIYTGLSMFFVAILTLFLEVPVLSFTYYWPVWAQFLPLYLLVFAVLLLLALNIRYSSKAAVLRSELIKLIRPSLFARNGEFVIGNEEKHLVVFKYNAWTGGVNALVDGEKSATRSMIDFRMGQDVLEFHLGEREKHNIRVIKALCISEPLVT